MRHARAGQRFQAGLQGRILEQLRLSMALLSFILLFQTLNFHLEHGRSLRAFTLGQGQCKPCEARQRGHAWAVVAALLEFQP